MTAQIIPFPTNRKSRTVERIWASDPDKATIEMIDEAMRELKTANGAMEYALRMVEIPGNYISRGEDHAD
jgi:hypothetical protein